MPTYPTAEAGRAWRAELEAAGKNEVGAFSMVGMSAFFAGPRVHMVDPLALTDPLLARLLPYRKERWLIGHSAELAKADVDLAALRASMKQAGAALRIAGVSMLGHWLELVEFL